MAEAYEKTWWTGPWGSALRQIYVTVIAAAATAGLDSFLSMKNEGKGVAFVILIMCVKGSEKALRASLATWVAKHRAKSL